MSCALASAQYIVSISGHSGRSFAAWARRASGLSVLNARFHSAHSGPPSAARLPVPARGAVFGHRRRPIIAPRRVFQRDAAQPIRRLGGDSGGGRRAHRVPDERGAVDAERVDHRQHIARRPFAEAMLRPARLPVPDGVDHDEVIVRRKVGREAHPDQPHIGEAVQQHHGRLPSLAHPVVMNIRAADRHITLGPCSHRSFLSRASPAPPLNACECIASDRAAGEGTSPPAPLVRSHRREITVRLSSMQRWRGEKYARYRYALLLPLSFAKRQRRGGWG